MSADSLSTLCIYFGTLCIYRNIDAMGVKLNHSQTKRGLIVPGDSFILFPLTTHAYTEQAKFQRQISSRDISPTTNVMNSLTKSNRTVRNRLASLGLANHLKKEAKIVQATNQIENELQIYTIKQSQQYSTRNPNRVPIE